MEEIRFLSRELKQNRISETWKIDHETGNQELILLNLEKIESNRKHGKDSKFRIKFSNFHVSGAQLGIPVIIETRNLKRELGTQFGKHFGFRVELKSSKFNLGHRIF